MLLLSFSLYGQKQDNIWPMGYIGDTAAGACNYYIDFTDSFDVFPTCLGVELFQMGNSAISDSTGNLLFYTNGCLVADSSHQIMNNGTGINNNTNAWYNDNGYPAKTLIMPKPNSPNQYYLFHLEYTTFSDGQINSVFPRWFNYSIIDLSENNGLGDVISKNIVLLDDSIGGGGTQLTACKHANGEDWWILLPKYTSNAYYRFLLTSDSLYGPFRQEVGYSFSWIDWSGQDIFSPDGSLYLRYDPQNQAHLYGFNRCNGELSYRQQINVPSNSNAGGAAISPNSRFLYIGNDTIVFQYDLQSADINASRVTVVIYDGFQSPFQLATNFWQMQLAPNGKIYCVASGSTDRLHVIENPDSAGLACNFRQHAITSPFCCNGISLPNFPHFRTPALAPGACDTTGVAVIPVVKERIKISPNPSHNGSFNIAWQGAADRVQAYDMLGRLCYEKVLPEYAQESELDTFLGKGIYLIVLKNNGNLVGREKIVILD